MASVSNVDLLARELDESRGRESGYRERLALRATLREKLGAYADSLQRVLRNSPPSRRHLSQTLLDVARISSQALDVGRVSVWLFDDDSTRLRCTVQLVDGADRGPAGLSIDTTSCPAYVRALSESRAVAVESVFDDPRTAELHAYCREHGVHALLDIPIFIPGLLLGVVCHEHVARPRAWQDEEVDFATSVGSYVALALETERRLIAEYTARGSEAKYRYLVESLPVTVYSFSFRSGKLDYVSPRAVELGGWTAERWLSEGAERWIERIHPEDRGLVRARFDKDTPGFPEEVTYRLQGDEGTRWIRDTCRLVRDPVGLPVAIQGMLADVTEQTKERLQRAELERRIRVSLENVDLLAVMLDAAGVVTFVNEHFVRTTRFSRESTIGTDWFAKVSADAESAQAARDRYRRDLLEGEVMPRQESRLRTESGEERKILWTSTLLRRPDGTPQGACFLGLDVTRQTQLEAEILQQTKLESLGRLAAGVAHDFNNLLAVMKLEASVMMKSLSDGPPRDSQRALMTALDQATSLTRSLLVYGRKQHEAKERVEVDELLRETQPLLSAVADRVMLVPLPGAPLASVVIDPTHLRQIVLNLVGNAVDATRERGGYVRVATHLEVVDEGRARRRGAAAGGEFVVLTVSDNGSGIDPQTLPQVFDPFFTTKEDGRGTGLGLPMCRSIVERAQGFMTLESTKGVGTTFRVYLPRAPESPVSPAAPPSRGTPARGEDRGGPPLVLVVEDMAPIRDFVVESLRAAGFRVRAAAQSTTAAYILSSEPVDLLITDGTLPDGSGSALARSARTVRPELRILLMSGAPDDSAASFDGVLVKPFNLEVLLRAVHAAVGPVQEGRDRPGAGPPATP